MSTVVVHHVVMLDSDKTKRETRRYGVRAVRLISPAAEMAVSMLILGSGRRTARRYTTNVPLRLRVNERTDFRMYVTRRYGVRAARLLCLAAASWQFPCGTNGGSSRCARCVRDMLRDCASR